MPPGRAMAACVPRHRIGPVEFRQAVIFESRHETGQHADVLPAQALHLVRDDPHRPAETAAGNQGPTIRVQRANHFTRCLVVLGVDVAAGRAEDDSLALRHSLEENGQGELEALIALEVDVRGLDARQVILVQPVFLVQFAEVVEILAGKLDVTGDFQADAGTGTELELVLGLLLKSGVDLISGRSSVPVGQRYRSQFLADLCTGNNDKKFASDGIKNAWLSVNRANVEAYNNDPLCGFVFTVNGYRNGLFKLMKDIYSPDGWPVTKPDMPIHFIAGADDPCIINLKKFSQAVSFLRNRGYREVTSQVYPGMRHEILNETGREDVWRDVRTRLDGWLAR